jgi:hypothetical protein
MQTDDLELKKLVYLYLINYAKTQPDLAIMAVNTFVKDSQDPNPLIRALAVRTMGCIRVDKITEYLCDPLQRCLKASIFLLSFSVFVFLTLGGPYEEREAGSLHQSKCLSIKVYADSRLTIFSRVCSCRTTIPMCARQRRCAWPSCTTYLRSWWRTEDS